MATLTFSLPQAMREFIEKQVEEGGFGTVSEYLRSLVREDQKRKARAAVEQALLEGLNSGVAGVADSDYWRNKKAELLRKHQHRKAG
ncbi:MAG: type II toxin-antitoxin system ParD family antitoxin [Armatimonadota bacterium]